MSEYYDKKNLMQSLTIFLCLTIFLGSTTGCEPLRKKFKRKKKEELREVQPILDPIDYKPVEKSPQDNYSYHYSLWSVWEKELEEALVRNEENNKRLNYLLNEIFEQLGQMKLLVTEEKQKEFQLLLDEFSGIKNELSKPKEMRNMIKVKNDVMTNSKKIRTEFKPQVVENFLIKE